MKFTLANIFYVVLVAALCLGWWIDHTDLESRIERSNRHSDSLLVGSVWLDARRTYYQAVSTKLIANDQLSTMIEEDLIFAFMMLFDKQKEVDVYLRCKGEDSDSDILPTKILLVLECEASEHFIEKLNLRYSNWFPAIEKSKSGSSPLKERIDNLLLNVTPDILNKLRSDRASLERNPW